MCSEVVVVSSEDALCLATSDVLAGEGGERKKCARALDHCLQRN